jgi:hypothetical protein
MPVYHYAHNYIKKRLQPTVAPKSVIDGLRVTRTIQRPIDIPNAGIFPPQMPENVYVVAGGPNGKVPSIKIPRSEHVIACNGSILMPRKFAWWCAFDYRMVNYPWWSTIKIDGFRTIFGARLINRMGMEPKVRVIKPDYYFEYMPEIHWPTKLRPKTNKTLPENFLKERILRGGTTVAGIAIQFAHYGGAKNIILCGVDMFGVGHWDGFTNPDPYKLCTGVWPWAEPLQILCDEVGKRGSKVWTLSKTALKLPMWE